MQVESTFNRGLQEYQSEQWPQNSEPNKNNLSENRQFECHVPQKITVSYCVVNNNLKCTAWSYMPITPIQAQGTQTNGYAHRTWFNWTILYCL